MEKCYLYFMPCLFICSIINAAERTPTDAWSGSQYKDNSSAQYHYGVYALSQIPFKEDDIILDVGCGTGQLTAEMAKRVPLGQVVGIDNSYAMLKQAQESYGTAASNLTFQSADATTFKSNILFN